MSGGEKKINSAEDIREMLFIYNPTSGRGTVKMHLAEILEEFENAGYMIKVYKMRYPGDINYIAEHEGRKVGLVVCAGGDGTLNGVVSGVMHLPEEERPDVGLIPTGTTNDIRRSYNVPANIVKAANLAVNGEPFATDIGSLNDKYFAYVASLGELSAVSCFTSQVAKNLLGRAAYLAEGLRQLLQMKSNKLKITYGDDEVIEGDFFLGIISNSTSVGGFPGLMGKNVDLQDGQYEVMLVKKPANIAEFTKELQTITLDENRQEKVVNDLVVRFKTSHLIVESEDEVQWVVDGENAGRYKRAEITNHNKAVNIISGPAAK